MCARAVLEPNPFGAGDLEHLILGSFPALDYTWTAGKYVTRKSFGNITASPYSVLLVLRRPLDILASRFIIFYRIWLQILLPYEVPLLLKPSSDTSHFLGQIK